MRSVESWKYLRGIAFPVTFNLHAAPVRLSHASAWHVAQAMLHLLAFLLTPYLMNRADEIALARTAAPPSVSTKATVLVLGAKGYETAVQGTNGFVCLVERSWFGQFNQPGFFAPIEREP